MKNIFKLILCPLIPVHLFAQEISNNGKYILKEIPDKQQVNIVVRCTDEKNSWTKQYLNTNSPVFTPDSKRLVFMTNDSLKAAVLGTDEIWSVAGVRSFKQPKGGNGEWLGYSKSNDELVLHNFLTGKETHVAHTHDFLFEDKGRILLIETAKTGTALPDSLSFLNLSTGQFLRIYGKNPQDSSTTFDNYIFSPDGNRVAFMVHQKKDTSITNSIWYYATGMGKAEPLVDDRSPGIDTGLIISDSPLRFSEKGTRLFFNLREKSLPKPNPDLPKVDIWSYTDVHMQSQQLAHLTRRYYAATVSVVSPKVIRITKENDMVIGNQNWSSNAASQETDDYVLICQFKEDVRNLDDHEGYLLSDYAWNRAKQYNIRLVSFKDGKTYPLLSNIVPTAAAITYCYFTPDGNAVVYFDPKQKNYFCYEIASGRLINISKGIKTPLIKKASISIAVRGYYDPFGILSWLPAENAALVMDSYQDIWKVSLTGKTDPLNITNGYLKKHPWLNLFNYNGYSTTNDRDEQVLFKVTDMRNFNQGFFRKDMTKKGDPELLTLRPWDFEGINKAKDTDVFLVKKESSSVPKQDYYTTDFRHFKPVGNSAVVTPGHYKKELLTWKGSDAQTCDGILIKPKGFDPHKKYPVIICYYENAEGTVIDRLNSFMQAYPTNKLEAFAFAEPPLAYCLNNGYVIFIPSIEYKLGRTGESVCNSVLSGAKYISRLSFVDAKHIGICGHSFGGFETNYLVTHSHLFAAACSGAGLTDYYSEVGTESKDDQGFVYSDHAEYGQIRLGVNPWERPDIYFKNSPIFYADRVTTPLMMMANDHDFRVPISQGLELFTALRRLGKRAWLLNYNGQGHGVAGIDGEDWGIRYMQFFDHYLKGAPAPVWMTRGIPARMKGIETGLEYDTTMKAPGPGLYYENKAALTPEQKELLKHKTTINDQGRVVDVKEK